MKKRKPSDVTGIDGGAALDWGDREGPLKRKHMSQGLIETRSRSKEENSRQRKWQIDQWGDGTLLQSLERNGVTTVSSPDHLLYPVSGTSINLQGVGHQNSIWAHWWKQLQLETNRDRKQALIPRAVQKGMHIRPSITPRGRAGTHASQGWRLMFN